MIFFFLLNEGVDGVIYNGIPDWLYLNTPELRSDTLAFSSNGSYLSYLSFNDSQVNEYEYEFLNVSPYKCKYNKSFVTVTHGLVTVGNIHASNQYVIQKKVQQIQMLAYLLLICLY